MGSRLVPCLIRSASGLSESRVREVRTKLFLVPSSLAWYLRCKLQPAKLGCTSPVAQYKSHVGMSISEQLMGEIRGPLHVQGKVESPDPQSQEEAVLLWTYLVHFCRCLTNRSKSFKSRLKGTCN